MSLKLNYMSIVNVHEVKTNFSKLLEPFPNAKAVHRQFEGGGFRLQEQAGRPLTPEYLNELAACKYDD